MKLSVPPQSTAESGQPAGPDALIDTEPDVDEGGAFFGLDVVQLEQVGIRPNETRELLAAVSAGVEARIKLAQAVARGGQRCPAMMLHGHFKGLPQEGHGGRGAWRRLGGMRLGLVLADNSGKTDDFPAERRQSERAGGISTRQKSNLSGSRNPAQTIQAIQTGGSFVDMVGPRKW